MSRVLKPPGGVTLRPRERSVFLAGSIDMGAARDWQSGFEEKLADLDVAILNPRRDVWDATWVQELTNPLFVEQVEWELAGLESADVIAMYFDARTQAPITLLELGLFARSGKVIVCCPEGFWRKGNVDVVCRRFGIEQPDDLDGLVSAVRERLMR